MLQFKPSDVEFLTEGTLRPLGNERFKFVVKCRDLTTDERRSYVWIEVYDQDLARYLNENAKKGSRVRIEAKLKTQEFTPKGSDSKVKEFFSKDEKKKVTAYNVLVTSATILE